MNIGSPGDFRRNAIDHDNFAPFPRHNMVSGTAFAYVTLLTKTSYLPGVLVLHHGLRVVESKHPLVVMVTPSLPRSARDVLRKQGITLREVEMLQPREGVHVLAEHDVRFGDTWTKLRYALSR
jgi:hypothetical protein